MPTQDDSAIPTVKPVRFCLSLEDAVLACIADQRTCVVDMSDIGFIVTDDPIPGEFVRVRFDWSKVAF